MTHPTDVATLVRWMAADFSNQAQAIENPPFYAHIRVCMRPLPYKLLSGVSLFLEQAYDYMLNYPYRLRILKFTPQTDHILLENYLVQDEAAFYGASRNLDLLHTLTSEQIEKLPGCDMLVEWTAKASKAEWNPARIVSSSEMAKRLTSTTNSRSMNTSCSAWIGAKIQKPMS